MSKLSDRPFRSARYQLADDIALVPLQDGEADQLGAEFAKIDPWKRLQFSADRLASFFAEPAASGVRFAIRKAGTTAGFVCVEPHWLCGPYLHFLGILPAHQRAGIGDAVVSWFVDQAEVAGNRNAWICVSLFNEQAQRFYLRHGFAEAAQLDDLVRDDEHEILLRKQVFIAGNADAPLEK